MDSAFWIWIIVAVLVVVGVSVLVGRNLSKPAQKPLSREERMTALKASGALRHRKSNRN
jgi:peptidoglycan/LPS O-acetylase OafA/YrhL